MEVLKKLQEEQNDLEDAFRMEITYEEVNETKEGKRLLKYLRKRHRIVNYLIRVLDRI